MSDPANRGLLTFVYDTCSAGRLCSVADWVGRTVHYGYDASGRLSQVWDRQNPPPAAPITTFAYAGTSAQLTSITDANTHVAVQNFYDTAGRVAEQHDARGAVTCLYYGKAPGYSSAACPGATPPPTTGQTIQVDSLGNRTTFSYDSASRTTQVRDAVGGVTAFTYDTDNNRTGATDARGNTTGLCYDVDSTGATVPGSRGNLTRVIAPPAAVGGTPVVSLVKYDARNNVVETVAPKGVHAPKGTTCGTTLNTALDPLFATDLAYDATLGTELQSVTRKYTDPDLGQHTAITRFAYADAANPGLVTSVTSPRNNATTLAYNASGAQADQSKRHHGAVHLRQCQAADAGVEPARHEHHQ